MAPKSVGRASAKPLQATATRRKSSLSDSVKKEKGRSRNACDRCKQKKVKVRPCPLDDSIHVNLVASVMAKVNVFARFVELETTSARMPNVRTKTNASTARGKKSI